MPFSDTLDVRRVRNGKGIVALKSFRRGAVICEITGKIVDAAEVLRYWDRNPRRAENCFRYDAERYIDPERNIGAFANHSCNPNAGIVKRGARLLLKAIAPISTGDEVTHDYSTLLGADDVWKMKCNCGEPNCRKVVKNIDALPAAVFRRYVAMGIIPAFILATRTR